LILKRDIAAHSRHTVSSEQCQRLLFALSLAAGDPTSLCTNGEPFRFGNEGEPRSWLRKSNFTDVGSGASRQQRLPRMEPHRFELDLSSLGEWIKLEVVLLGNPGRPERNFHTVALGIINEATRAGLGGGYLGLRGLGPRYESWRAEVDAPSEGSVHSFTILVATILQFGPTWMLEMATKCGFASPALIDEMKDLMQTHFPDGFDTEYLTSLAWSNDEAAKSAVNCVMRVAHWVIRWSLLNVPREHHDQWKPLMYSMDCGLKTLIIAPVDANPFPAIPLALFREGYDRLSRVWLLELTGDPWMEREPDQHNRFFIRGKSILFADLSGADYEAALRARVHAPMKVYGPL
jgi:hypothetical protein